MAIDDGLKQDLVIDDDWWDVDDLLLPLGNAIIT